MYNCKKCDDSFVEIDDLFIHLYGFHELGIEVGTNDEGIEGERCKCKICGEIYEDWGDLGMHLVFEEDLGEEI